MAFNPIIPQPTDKISQSQAQILGNFTAIATVTSPDAGSTLFPQQGSDASTGANVIGLYSKQDPNTAQTEIFLRRPSNGAVNAVTSSKNGLSSGSATGQGWSALPSGIIFAWGRIAFSSGANQAYTFAQAFPNNCFSITLTLIPGVAGGGLKTDVVSVVDGTLTVNGFTARCYSVNNTPAPESGSAYFLAIGN